MFNDRLIIDSSFEKNYSTSISTSCSRSYSSTYLKYSVCVCEEQVVDNKVRNIRISGCKRVNNHFPRNTKFHICRIQAHTLYKYKDLIEYFSDDGDVEQDVHNIVIFRSNSEIST